MKKQFIITIDGITSGGAERRAVTLANYFAGKGYRVTIINSDKDSAFYQIDHKVEVIKMGLDYSKSGVKYSTERFLKKLHFLKEYFRRNRSGTVLTFLPNMEMPTIIAAKLCNVKVYTVVCADPRTYTPLIRIFRMLMFPRIEGVVFQTAKVKAFHDYKNVKRAAVIANPLWLEFKNQPVSLPVAQRKNKIFTVGRLETVKNQEGLIRVFSRVSLDFPDIRLYIWGEGPLRDQLQKLIEELKMQEKIFLPGVERDTMKKNRDALLFILNSYSEGMPNSLMEAMAYGIPVISTDFFTGAARELIRDGENGFLVPVDDEAKLEEKIRYVLSNDEIAERIGQEATKIYQVYNVERICAEWERFLFR